jgi:hypothetical protein
MRQQLLEKQRELEKS